MSGLIARRSIISLAVIASLFGGAVALRAAAGWTASAAPLVAPPNPATLVTTLQDEKARADAVAGELAQVVQHARELEDALAAAQAKAAADGETASGLAKQLAEAQARLGTLQGQAGVSGSSGSGASGPGAPSPEHEGNYD